MEIKSLEALTLRNSNNEEIQLHKTTQITVLHKSQTRGDGSCPHCLFTLMGSDHTVGSP